MMVKVAIMMVKVTTSKRSYHLRIIIYQNFFFLLEEK